MELRQYQIDAIAKLRAVMSNGKRRVILQAPCAFGKTILACEIALRAIERGKHVLFLNDRRDLVFQSYQKFVDYGLGNETAILMAGEKAELKRPIQIASIQTYHRRLNLEELSRNPWFYQAELVIYDEAHTSTARTRKNILELYNDKYILGLSATPCRADGTGLGSVFQEIIVSTGIKELTEMGYLVPMVYYAPDKPDLDRLRIIAGDYERRELGERVNKPKLVGSIFDNWVAKAGNRQTIIFAVNVKHSRHLRDHFLERGVRAEHIDAHTPDDERAGIYARFEAGDTQVLVNVGICTEGSDLPFVSCIVLARPTKSLGRYIQMAGRGVRPCSGKQDCILLDHAGIIAEHNHLLEDPVEWSLEGKKLAFRKKTTRIKEKKLMTCEACGFVFTGPVCRECGTPVKDYGKKIAYIEADLVRVKGKEKFGKAEKQQFFQMLEWHRRSKGYAEGWSAHKFRERFGVWPRDMKGLPPVEPDQTFRNYMKHLQIRWAKRREKENAIQSVRDFEKS